MINKPPCADWSLWVGEEIEGSEATGKGIKTLFVRSLAAFPSLLLPDSDLSILRTKSNCTRVWFCKEFEQWALMLRIAELFQEACLEVEPKRYSSVPMKVRKKCRVFIKVGIELKPGDVICVGPAFADESFTIGTGNKVTPEQYGNDKRIA